MMVEVVPALVLYCIIYMMSINSSPPYFVMRWWRAVWARGSVYSLVLAKMARERGYTWTYLRHVRLNVSEAAQPHRVRKTCHPC